jgi:hypothetical protein
VATNKAIKEAPLEALELPFRNKKNPVGEQEGSPSIGLVELA